MPTRPGLHQKLWIGLIGWLTLSTITLWAQVGWKFEYISNTYSHWKHLGSGDTTVIARLTFSQTDAVIYRLTEFTLRPLTNHPSAWFIDKLLLWKDNGNNRFDSSDTLITDTFRPASIPVQAAPTYALTSAAVSVLLQSNRYLFITAVMHDWHDADPENIEVDESSAGPQGYWFTVVDSLKDIQITPIPGNASINPYTLQYFQLTAQNLPVTIRNPAPSAAEDDSTKLNMFFPKWQALNGSQSSRAQRLTDQEFAADIFLPVSQDIQTIKLESVELDFGFDNTILDLQAVNMSSWWGEPASFFVTDTLYLVESGATTPNLTTWHWRAELKNALQDTITYRLVDNNPLIRLSFKVLKPGISPLFLDNIVIYDHCHIRLHPYQVRQNYANLSPTAFQERADAWAKFILGDLTYPFSKSLRADNPYLGDGRVTWEDVTVFSNFIWLNPNSSNWYNRFDLAGSATHDPDELMPDDTTNFFDLLQLVRNYYRTNAQYFAQKPNQYPSEPVQIAWQAGQAADCAQYNFVVTASQPLTALHARLRFDPRRLAGICYAGWIAQTAFYCYPEELLKEGILDLNLAFLNPVALNNTPLFTIEISDDAQHSESPDIDRLEIFDREFRQLAWRMLDAPEHTEQPIQFALLHAFPNPFNTLIQINYTIPSGQAGKVSCAVYDLQGKLIKTLLQGEHSAGRYRLEWDGTNSWGRSASSGVYLLCLKTHQQTLTRKVILLR